MASSAGHLAAEPELRPPDNRDHPEVIAAVRACVRGLLEQNQAFVAADPDERRSVAQKMVKVALVGAALAARDFELSKEIAAGGAPAGSLDEERSRPGVLATAQSAGDQLGMQATKASAGTINALKKAIDFPAFVTSLINGVFQAITSSAATQLTALSELLDNVSASADSFTEQNVQDGEIVTWAAGKFPFLIRKDDGLALRDGDELSSHAKTLQEGLSASDSEVSSIDDADLVSTLGPLVRRKIGRDRQQVLGTLVQMGLQRIVVDEGRLHASMDMRVDTRSGSDEQKQNRSEFGIEAKVSGSFGAGPWGASASVGTNYSQVQSDDQYTKEEIDTRASLRSSVDLAFRTEQIPLDRMADKNARVKLDLNARVPANVSDGASLISSDRSVGAVPAPPRTPLADAAPAKAPVKPAAAKPADAKKPEAKPAAKAATPPAKAADNKPAAGKTVAAETNPSPGTGKGASQP